MRLRVLLKRLIKNIAYDHEMDTTFMAKPPGQAGNGLHVHISLLDKNGNNIFATDNPLDSQPLPCHRRLADHGGPMAFLCPNVNSYRRFGAQFYVPNARQQSLPTNLRDALRELDDSEIMARYISPDYIDIFVACKESELAEFEHSISDLEYNWYLHTVQPRAGVLRSDRRGGLHPPPGWLQ